MKTLILILLWLPALLCAQDFQFRFEPEGIPVEIQGWEPYTPWLGGESESYPEFCDINNDSKLELFIGNYWGVINYFTNSGSVVSPNWDFTSFTYAGVNIYNSTFIGRTSPIFCDLDADGDFDLFTGDFRGLIHYWENIGTPSNPEFQFITDTLANIQVNGFSKMDFKDLDADGDFDLLIGDYFGRLWYFRNDGTPQNFSFTLVSQQFLGIDVGDYASPRLIDIDADGDYDLFIGENYGHIWYYRNDGDSVNYNFTYVTDNYVGIDVGDYASPEFADIDGDGDYDLLIGPGAIPGPPGLYLYLNQGTPQQPNYVLYSNNLVPGIFNQNSVVLVPCTTDIDADGDQDLFVSDDNGYCYLFRNVGSPTNFQFQYESSNWQGLAYPLGHFNMCFYDIDGDGDLDLFKNRETAYLYPWDKNLQFYRNIGTPQNANLQLELEDVFPELMIWNSAPYLIDMDQDGDGDLFVGDAWGGIRYFKNVTGDTTAVPLPGTAPARPCKTTLSIGPNPSNPITAISYKLQAASVVNLAVYDIAGRLVTRLVSGKLLAGEHTVSWDATGNASGVYLIQLLTPQEAVVRKVVVVK